MQVVRNVKINTPRDHQKETQNGFFSVGVSAKKLKREGINEGGG